MSVIGDVFGSLRTMTLLQLLLAFLACTGYAIAQGALVSARGRRFAASAAAGAAFCFALESAHWPQAAMLMAFGVAGMGLFVAAVWVTSLSIGFARSSVQASSDVALADPATAPTGLARASAHRPTKHAHSV
jgi:hypothetical protein